MGELLRGGSGEELRGGEWVGFRGGKWRIDITPLPMQRLSSPHRYLVLKMSASEVQELNVRPGFRHRHRRVFFFFNDMVVVAKRRSNTEFLYKDSLSLLNILPVKFETHCKELC